MVKDNNMQLRTAIEVCNKIKSDKAIKIIGIDGFCGAGKTHLSNAIQTLIGCPSIDTDDFVLIKDSNLDYAEILDLRAIDKALNEDKIVICGICLKGILNKIGRKADITIYVKKVSENGLWHEGLNFEEFEEGTYPVKLNEPDLSVYKYHSRHRPHENADIIYERVVPNI